MNGLAFSRRISLNVFWYLSDDHVSVRLSYIRYWSGVSWQLILIVYMEAQEPLSIGQNSHSWSYFLTIFYATSLRAQLRSIKASPMKNLRSRVASIEEASNLVAWMRYISSRTKGTATLSSPRAKSLLYPSTAIETVCIYLPCQHLCLYFEANKIESYLLGKLWREPLRVVPKRFTILRCENGLCNIVLNCLYTSATIAHCSLDHFLGIRLIIQHGLKIVSCLENRASRGLKIIDQVIKAPAEARFAEWRLKMIGKN